VASEVDDFKISVEDESLRLLQYVETREVDVIVMIMAIHGTYISLLRMLKRTGIPPRKLIPLVTALKIGDEEELGNVAVWLAEELGKADHESQAAGIA
jgi:hypothetical protein